MGLLLDGCACNSNLDSSGEILDVHGHDISTLTEGRGVINFEHSPKAEDIIGAIVYAKKIYKKADCETERQRMFFDLVKGPYVYIIGELFNDASDDSDQADHAAACAVASMLRYYAARKEKMFIGWSIEGSTLQRDGNTLKRSVGKNVALTLKPCNKSAYLGVIDDSQVKEAIKKFEGESNIRSFEVDTPIVDDPILDIRLSIDQLNKCLTAGNSNAAPSTLTGGAALSVEDPNLKSKRFKNRVVVAIRDWNRARPLKEAIKAALPEVSDEYVDYFTDLANDMLLRKHIPAPQRIDAQHFDNSQADDDQKKLVTGLYFEPLNRIPEGEKLYPGPRSFKAKNDAGQEVVIKEPDASGPEAMDSARKATAYYHAAKNVFGLGDHVPVTAYFNHPTYPQGDTGASLFQAREATNGARAAHGISYQNALKSARESGTDMKLMLMDKILGIPNRNMGNTVVHQGKIKHIDNDEAFDGYGNQQSYQLDDATKSWLAALDPRKLAASLAAMGLSRNQIQNAVLTLKTEQQRASAPTQPLGDPNV